MLRQIASVGGLTLVSRVLGFLRDILMAVVLGAGPIADAFFVAFRLPNHFRALLAEGAFNAAFVPLFTERLTQDGMAAAKRFAEQLISWLIATQLLLLIAVELAMPAFMLVFAHGFSSDPAKFEMAVLFTRITFPYLLLISLTALMGGLLNSAGRFGAAAAAPILMNLCFIGGQLGLTPLLPTAGHAASWAVAAAGVAQFLYLAWDCRRAGYDLHLPWPRLDPDVRRFFRVFGPAALGAGLTQISLLLDTLIATLLPTGAVSYLYYADRLNQLPLGVIGIAIGTVLLPALSRHLKAGNQDAASDSQNRALEWSLLATLPAAALFLVAGGPIVATLFQWRAFGVVDTAGTSATLWAYAPGLPAFVALRALLPGFYARGDTTTPVRVAVASVALNIALKLALIGGLAQVGLALATSVAAWANLLMLGAILYRRGHFTPDARLRRTLIGSFPAALLPALLVWLLTPWLQAGLDATVPATRVAALAALLSTYGFGFALIALAMDLGGIRKLVRRG